MPYIAPAIWPAMAPTVSQSPPMLAFTRATSLKLLVCQTVWRAIARASMQQDPTQPGLSSALVWEQVKFISFQFQFRSLGVILNIWNFLPQRLHIMRQSSSGSSMLSARYCTLVQLVWKPLHASSKACLGVLLVRLQSSVRILERSLQHSFASVPLWVVLLEFSAYSIAISLFCLKAIAMGASLISDPFPLLNWSPSSQQSSLRFINSSMEILMLPPKPMECFLPPLLSPLKNHSRKRQRICFGKNWYLQQMRESAIQRAMLQSSVQMPTLPARASRKPFSMASSISLKPSFIKAQPDLVQGENQVLAPRASQMARPSSEAMQRSTSSSPTPSILGSYSPPCFILSKVALNLMRSLSFSAIMLNWFSRSCQKERQFLMQVGMQSVLMYLQRSMYDDEVPPIYKEKEIISIQKRHHIYHEKEQRYFSFEV